MTTLITVFISGVAVGVLVMALAATRSLDRYKQQNEHLTNIIKQKDEELSLYNEYIHSLQYSKSLDRKFDETEEKLKKKLK